MIIEECKIGMKVKRHSDPRVITLIKQDPDHLNRWFGKLEDGRSIKVYSDELSVANTNK